MPNQVPATLEKHELQSGGMSISDPPESNPCSSKTRKVVYTNCGIAGHIGKYCNL